jgi:hypothetical protein
MDHGMRYPFQTREVLKLRSSEPGKLNIAVKG